LRPKDSIVAPPKGSEHATAVASKAPKALNNAAEDKDNKDIKAFDAYLIDNYNSLNFT
jgi:hypothetical protein